MSGNAALRICAATLEAAATEVRPADPDVARDLDELAQVFATAGCGDDRRRVALRLVPVEGVGS